MTAVDRLKRELATIASDLLNSACADTIGELEALDAGELCEDADPGACWDAVCELLTEAIEAERVGRIEDLADHAVENAELRRAVGGRR